jgi:hypothetical protein
MIFVTNMAPDVDFSDEKYWAKTQYVAANHPRLPYITTPVAVVQLEDTTQSSTVTTQIDHDRPPE